MKIKNSKEDLHKAHEASTNKKNEEEKAKKKKGSEKRRADEKRENSPKKPQSGLVDHKTPLPKHTNFHTLNATQSRLYSVRQEFVQKAK